ncbi:hypothetical protein [Parabacteroides sp. HGS0025]|jgi:hypothetical protein|uniref:hypothetical protein n=1 Tax=Parabacteroides sp. HGS0025 TaxID=1078087 RepID=UPI0006175189|nr:hypothetical protein [Parabacteroides sp. HGS0025]KKB45125.1 hypothetical protein HMPREF1212_05293 [Parabacteroides sp. HGS0025]
MTPINIEGIVVTEKLISFIKQFQNDPEFMDAQIGVIDNAITLIACDCVCEKGREQEALNAIADLCFLKRDIRLLEGKED